MDTLDVEMKFLCFADLHLDFWEDAKTDPLEGCEKELIDLDLLLIGGDLGSGLIASR